MKVDLYRVYEAVVRDDEGNQIRSEMIYGRTKREAVERAQEMLTEELWELEMAKRQEVES